MKKLLILIAIMTICDAYGEGVYWFTNDSLTISSLNSVSGCEGNDNITKPSDPQKEGGFRFIGWEEGDTDSFIATYVTNNGTAHAPTDPELGVNTWTATFSWGTVAGAWRCSTDGSNAICSSSGTAATCITNVNPTLDNNGCGTDNSPDCPNKSVSGNNAKYCWCKVTDFAGKSVSSLAWVLNGNYASPNACARNCVVNCGNRVHTNPVVRQAVFGVAGS